MMMRSRHVVAAGTAACALGELLSGCGSRDNVKEASVHQSAALAVPVSASSATAAAWRATILAIPLPKIEGCFEASLPSTVWTEVPCAPPPPPVPYFPVIGPGQQNKQSLQIAGTAQQVGNGNDFAGYVENTISPYAVGTFASVTGVTSETGTTYGANCANPVTGVPNIYSLQMNTNRFATSVCNNAGCQGWQQYIYSASTSVAYIQSWLIGYTVPCPQGWFVGKNPATGQVIGCYSNSAPTQQFNEPITNLVNLSITARAATGGGDTVTFSTGTSASSVGIKDSKLGLAAAWTGVEFNVVGDGCGSQANFNSGANIVVSTAMYHNQPGDAPFCTVSTAPNGGPFNGGTAETNNLALVAGSCCPIGGSAPGFSFVQSNATGIKSPFCVLNDVIPNVQPML